MPTLEEIQELVDNCYFEGGYLNEVAGNFVIGPNGNSIFIPFAGYPLITSITLECKGYRGCYWSGTQDDDYSAYYLDCDRQGCFWSENWERVSGMSVRPVSN